MDKDELKRRVDAIVAVASDDERAHSNEDDLHRELIRQFCPKWVVDEIERLDNTDFHRWCA